MHGVRPLMRTGGSVARGPTRNSSRDADMRAPGAVGRARGGLPQERGPPKEVC